MTAASMPVPGWRRLWRRRRDRLLTDPAFRERASRFVATRPVARRQAVELFDLMAGFVYSQVLLACVQLQLFERLADAPRDAATLARESGLSQEAAQRLLQAAEALRLVEPHGGGRYGLGSLGALLVDNEALTALVEHHRALYADLADPLEMLRRGRGGGELARCWAYTWADRPGELPREVVEPFSRVMSASQPLIARQVLDAFPLDGHRRLLDIGGGQGAFVAAALQRTPGLRATVFDLPAIAATARERFSAEGVADRAEFVGGDFHRDPLPTGADLISIVRVLYDHDEPAVRRLLGAARQALAGGGTLIVAEPMADTPGAERMGAAYFGMYLWAMGSGRARSAAELGALLRQAGFDEVAERPTAVPLQTRVLVARVKSGANKA